MKEPLVTVEALGEWLLFMLGLGLLMALLFLIVWSALNVIEVASAVGCYWQDLHLVCPEVVRSDTDVGYYLGEFGAASALVTIPVAGRDARRTVWKVTHA